jgi:hypothetical protein
MMRAKPDLQDYWQCQINHILNKLTSNCPNENSHSRSFILKESVNGESKLLSSESSGLQFGQHQFILYHSSRR